MELCTNTAIQTQSPISNLPNNNHNHRFFLASTNSAARVCTKSSFSLKQTPAFRSGYGVRSRNLYYTSPLTRATTSEETSSGPDRYFGEKRDSAIAVEDDPAVQKNVYSENVPTEVPKEESPVDGQANELLEKLNIKFDSEDTYSIALYGSGALLALWLASVVVGAVDSIPLFPKLMEVVGLGYTFWFSTRYLLFKENRDELATKIEELKQQVLGKNDD